MSPVVLSALGVMSMLTAVVVLFAARPAPSSLAATLSQLRADPTSPASAISPLRQQWMNRLVARVSPQDLEITGKTRAQVATQRLSGCLAAMFAPLVVGAVLGVAGVRLPIVVPGGLGLIAAIIVWFAQEAALHREAQRLRAQFAAALTAYLGLVAMERQVRGSPVEALIEAAQVSTSWPFRWLSQVLLHAEIAGERPWNGLRDLGQRIGVPQLESLADIAASADDGASVFASLMAEARTTRAAAISAELGQANADSAGLDTPLGLLALAPMILLILPGLLRLMSA